MDKTKISEIFDRLVRLQDELLTVSKRGEHHAACSCDTLCAATNAIAEGIGLFYEAIDKGDLEER